MWKINLFFSNFFNKKIKIFLFVIFIVFLIIWAYDIYQAILEFNKPNTYEQVEKIYKNQIYQSDFDNFIAEKKKDKIFRKITFPWVTTINYFEVVLEDRKNKKSLEVYTVYKNPNEEWTIDFSKYQSFTGIGFYTPETDKFLEFLTNTITWLLPLVFGLFIIVFLYKKMWLLPWSSKSIIKQFKGTDKNKITFEQIWGIDSIKNDIQDLITTLSNWSEYQKRGVRTIRWILFEGPPGVGKTMIAKAIASTLWIDMFIATWNDFRSEYLSQGPKRVHTVFKEIKKSLHTKEWKIAILFIDEIETIFKTRGIGHSEDSNVVNAFLHEIDGINWETNIIIIGATNHVDKLDSALLSRMDKIISFNYPTRKERLDIITKIINTIKEKDPELQFDKNLDINILAWNTTRMWGREIDNILNEVHRRAVRDKRVIDNALIQECFGDIILWKDNLNLEVNEKDKKIVIYHELGHWVIWYLNKKQVHTISIIPKWSALGLTWSLDKNEKVLKSPEDILKEIQELIAWRVAETIWIWEISTGSNNDYEKATSLAFSYFKNYNFEYNNQWLGFIITDKVIDNKVYESKILDICSKFVKKLIKDQEKIVKSILIKNKTEIDRLAEILKREEVIFEQELINSNLSL